MSPASLPSLRHDRSKLDQFKRRQRPDKSEACLCTACNEPITERWILQVNNLIWHSKCLSCCICQEPLDHQQSCFLKDGQIYCRSDYNKIFGAKCGKCSRQVVASDWVRRARNQVFHLACFACDACKRQLSTGEEFALHEDRVLCKIHYLESMDGGSTSNDENGDSDSQSKAKSKRVRTTFTDEQLQVLQANFQIDSNPDGQDLERIAQITGLSKRVTQVWFQNSRARQKKNLSNPNSKQQVNQSMDSKSRIAKDITEQELESQPIFHFMYRFRHRGSSSPDELSEQVPHFIKTELEC